MTTMKNLDEKNWRPFTVDYLFPNKQSTKGETTGQLVLGDDVPYIAAAKNNNGYAYMCKATNEKWISSGNAMVFVELGDGAAGIAHYVPMDFIGMSGKTSAGYSQSLTEDNGIFIANCLSANKKIFSHGHSWTGNRLKNSKAMLPSIDDAQPDYKYMETYTQTKRAAMLQRYCFYIEKQLAKLGEIVDIPALNEKTWGAFSIVKLFDSIAKGKISNASKLVKTDYRGIEYIAATNRNNGCLYFLEDNKTTRSMLQNGNCIGFIKDGDGSAGYAIYKREKFTSTVNVIYGYSSWLNEYNGLFFVTTQDMIQSKYSHGNKRNKEHLSKDKVMLPINEAGNPDYAYMEQYAKNLMIKKYKQYLNFIANKYSAPNLT